jgi:hypothetical protein
MRSPVPSAARVEALQLASTSKTGTVSATVKNKPEASKIVDVFSMVSPYLCRLLE